MKLKLWYFINKHAMLKKIFFWIFPLLGMSVAKAETIYQCTPCPSGLSSNPGTIGKDNCFDPVTKAGSQVFTGTANQSGTLQPGWYRISLRGTNGSNASAYGCSGSGGAGGTTYYAFYVSVEASYLYEYNSGSPKFTVIEDGKTRTFAATKGGNASAWCTNTYRGSCTRCTSSNGGAGVSNQVSGLFATDKKSSNVDALNTAGAKLTRL